MQITLQIWQEFCMFMYRFKYATSETCQGEHEERTWCCEWLLPIKAVWAKLRMGTPEQWQKKAHHIIITSVTLRQLSRREVTHGNSNSLINIKKQLQPEAKLVTAEIFCFNTQQQRLTYANPWQRTVESSPKVSKYLSYDLKAGCVFNSRTPAALWLTAPVSVCTIPSCNMQNWYTDKKRLPYLVDERAVFLKNRSAYEATRALWQTLCICFNYFTIKHPGSLPVGRF